MKPIGDQFMEAKKQVDSAIRVQKLKMVMDLCGFGFSAVAVAVSLIGNAIWWKFVLGGIGGYMMGAFAWRFVNSFWEMIFTYIVAAQKGTIYALMAQKDLDKFDCGDPDCEGCKARREQNV